VGGALCSERFSLTCDHAKIATREFGSDGRGFKDLDSLEAD
jgi:hypothetical protein